VRESNGERACLWLTSCRRVDFLHKAPPAQDIHCATFADRPSTVILGHQTSKGSEAPQLSYFRPKVR
jgi:hypothetical protein